MAKPVLGILEQSDDCVDTAFVNDDSVDRPHWCGEEYIQMHHSIIYSRLDNTSPVTLDPAHVLNHGPGTLKMRDSLENCARVRHMVR